MWVFTSKGFISVVQSDQDPDTFVVRARNRKHLEELFPKEQIVVLLGRDYGFRCFVDKMDFLEFMIKAVDNIDYTNFKDSIVDDNYHDACLRVWSVMYGYQNAQELGRLNCKVNHRIDHNDGWLNEYGGLL